MNLILCLDNRYGLLFNGRRQSRDRAVTEDILKNLSGGTLYLGAYSAPLFAETDAVVTEDFLDRAGENDFCFLENRDITPYLPKINRLILYRWNRDYPSDFQLDHAVLKNFRLLTSTDFAGYSHKKITKEVYEK